MAVTSTLYLLFLAVSITICRSLEPRYRIHAFGIISAIFCACAGWLSFGVLLFLVVWNYLGGLSSGAKNSTPVFVIGNIATLVVYKIQSGYSLFTEPIALLGISFLTLQGIAYVVDTKRGRVRVERNPLRFFVFMLWFPKVWAGPIERGHDLLPQLQNPVEPTSEDTKEALLLICQGFAKKLVVADNLAPMIAQAYGSPGDLPFHQLWIVVYAYAAQLFFDFSGYIDIARGTSLLFGIRLQENFDRPFAAKSVMDFWRRWHKTLSNWLFEFVYFPLTRRTGWPAISVVVTFVVSGLWHGTGLNFIVWGLGHGLVIAASSVAPAFKSDSRINDFLRIFATFNLVCWLWVFFRASDLSQAFEFISTAFSSLGSGRVNLFGNHLQTLVYASVGIVIELAFLYFPYNKARFALHMMIRLVSLLLLGEFSAQGFVYSAF